MNNASPAKLTTYLISILTIALVVAYTVLGAGLLREQRQEKELTSQLSEARASLAGEPAFPPDLDARLASAQAAVDAARKSMAEMPDSTQIINDILVYAGEAGVWAIPLTTQPMVVQAVENTSFSVLRLGLTVSGTFSAVSLFVKSLETGKLETLVVEQLSVDYHSGAVGSATPAEDTPVNARLDIAVYARPPAEEVK